MNINTVQRSGWSFVLDEPTRVLVVDDDPILLEFATVHLSSPDAVIETAPDGTTAWSMLTSGDYDVVLLDIVMPGPDGFSLLEKIRAEPKLRHLPVVMLTGNEDIVSIDRAYSLGADSFINKPVNWRLLSYHVRCVLRSSRLSHELTGARRDGALPESDGNYRSVLRAILHHAESCRGDGRTSAEAALQQIEALAAGALRDSGHEMNAADTATGAAATLAA
jgi:DNA-binding response OmpR family regulator